MEGSGLRSVLQDFLGGLVSFSLRVKLVESVNVYEASVKLVERERNS